MFMFEKVNPSHPDKIADRIAGAIVDIAYGTQNNPKIAVEVLIGHGVCHIIAETSADLNREKIAAAVKRIAGDVKLDLVIVPQDKHLAQNQELKSPKHRIASMPTISGTKWATSSALEI